MVTDGDAPSSGPGRRGAASHPAVDHDLDLRLLGETCFVQALDLLSVRGIEQPSALPGWTRKHVALHVIFNAEGFLGLVEWARTGVESPLYPSRGAWDQRIRETAVHITGADAISMAHEVVAELSDALDGMDADAWLTPLVSGRSGVITAASIPWLRAREVWMHSLDLRIGMSTRDFPSMVVDRLLRNIEREWVRRGEPVDYLIQLIDRPDRDDWVLRAGPEDARPAAPVRVVGEAAEVLSYLAGRGWPKTALTGWPTSEADEQNGGLPAPPRWL